MSIVWEIGRGGRTPIKSGDGLRDLLLEQRGVEAAKAKDFFEPVYEQAIHDPYMMEGMAVAVERLGRARKRKERVLVYGDYDADGVTSVAVLVDTLKNLGVQVLPYLPHRLEDGYGLNLKALRRLVSEFDVLVSVDCGISNIDEVEWLNTMKKDVIITDHHTIPKSLPPALAVLHPALGRYPFAFLSGAGVAWKLAQALYRDKEGQEGFDVDQEKWLLDLCCLGTVADMVPLIGENRAIASFGFEVLRRSRRPGIRMLIDSTQREPGIVDSDLISYKVAPLLNAAGRMDHAQPALDILLAANEQKARELNNLLQRYNRQRRSVSRRVQTEAEQMGTIDGSLVFAYSESWPAGVVGLVAGRLSEKFACPSVIVGSGGGHAVGSVRAPEGINVMELMGAAKQYVLKLGGHKSAAGFSVTRDKVSVLEAVLKQKAASGVKTKETIVTADAVISQELLNWNTVDIIEKFQPFGEKNKRPVFIGKRMIVAGWRPVGKAQEHAKINFNVNEEPIGGIGFGLAKKQQMTTIKSGSEVDVLFNLESNEYLGRRELQLKVTDIAPAGTVRMIESK